MKERIKDTGCQWIPIGFFLRVASSCILPFLTLLVNSVVREWAADDSPI